MANRTALHPELAGANWFDDSYQNWGPDGQDELRFIGKLKRSGYFAQFKTCRQSVTLSIYQHDPSNTVDARFLYSITQAIPANAKPLTNDDIARLIRCWLGSLFANSLWLPYPL